MSSSSSSERPADGSCRDLRYYTRQLRRHPAVRAWRRWSQNVLGLAPSLWRLATHELRQLPSAVIIGAQKAGTTQLFSYLTRHPRLLPACQKEIEYFSRYHDRSLSWYRSRFPLRSQVAAVGGQVLDASPSYICFPAALHRLRAMLPEARIIAILRDPVARAFSGYQHNKTRHREPRSFQQAVEAELRESRLRPQLGLALKADDPPMRRYVARGYYVLQLELLWHLFPREQTLILDSADLFRDTNAACQRVFEFLALERYDVQPQKIYNRGYYEERIDPLVAQRLADHYGPYDELLAGLFGRRFSWMKSAARAAA